MKIAEFGVESWLNKWEKSATYDISQSTIASMTIDELLQTNGDDRNRFFDDLGKAKMNYGWIEARQRLNNSWLASMTTSTNRRYCKQTAPLVRTT